MKSIAAFCLLACLAGCANTERQEGVVAQNDAVEDYISSAELKEIDAITTRGRLSHTEVTEKHIILTESRKDYLATFTRRCRELRDQDIQPDYRRDANKIRARFDTYRGCRIETLHELSKGQAIELEELAKKAQR